MSLPCEQALSYRKCSPFEQTVTYEKRLREVVIQPGEGYGGYYCHPPLPPYREDRARLFLQVHGKSMMHSGHKLQRGNFWLRIGISYFIVRLFKDWIT